MQESCRKDIERAFGVLQARWAVLRGPAYGWDRNRLTEIMTACIIMHNMIVEDEGPFAANIDFGDNSSRIDSSQIIGEGRAKWVIITTLIYVAKKDRAHFKMILSSIYGLAVEVCNNYVS
jgi:hypothetical protein